MENLTKTQVVLLALLISFVVSIVTGIVTVSLLERSPSEVPQTINRVIQQTIEKVTPTETKTVIIKEEDLVVEAININKNSVVTLLKETSDGAENIGVAFIVSKEGFIITTTKGDESEKYSIILNGKSIDAKFVANAPAGFSIFKTTLPKNFTVTKLADEAGLRPGQTLVFLGVSIGRSTFISLEKFSLPSTEGEMVDSFDIIKTVERPAGPSLVINLDGQVVGFASFLDETSFIIPASRIKETLK